MALLTYFVKRFALIIVSMIVVISISYTLMWYAPGNYLDIQRTTTGLAARFGENSPEFKKQRELFEERYGLDKPLPVQILTYIRKAATFSFGPSFSNPGVLIEDMVKERLPRTLMIVLLGLSLALIVGIPMGVLAALKRNTIVDYVVTSLSMVGQVIPSYVMAVAMILVFAGTVWNVLPVGGWTVPWPKPKEVVLPVVTLALGPMASIARFTRNQVAETLSQEYIRTARAKGVPERLVVWRHTLRNSLIPVVTVTVPQIGSLLIGAVWIETIFRIPGIGQMFANGNNQRDYPMMITGTVVLAMGIMLSNLLADILYAVLDPRIKLEA